MIFVRVNLSNDAIRKGKNCPSADEEDRSSFHLNVVEARLNGMNLPNGCAGLYSL